MHPFQTVNEPGFRKLLHVLEPRYEPPDRVTLAGHYMCEMCEKERERVLDNLVNADNYSLNAYFWTPCQNWSYETVTIHFINCSFDLQRHLLGTKEFAQSHTGLNIAEEIQNVLDEWNLSPEQVAAATTDNAFNMVLAIDLMEWVRIPCFSHSLQLAVEAALKLPTVSIALARCRRLVSHFHHSTKSMYLLHQKQIDLHYEELCLVWDVPTRWNSAYYMVEWIIILDLPYLYLHTWITCTLYENSPWTNQGI